MLMHWYANVFFEAGVDFLVDSQAGLSRSPITMPARCEAATSTMAIGFKIPTTSPGTAGYFKSNFEGSQRNRYRQGR